MKNKRIVPWENFDEWKRVYHGLFSDRSSLEFTSAISRAQIWKIRGRVPISVESTICLLEALHKWENASDVYNYEYQLLFGMAITRFVNGIVDRQQKGAYAVPVIQIAKEMNIPRVLVDIRHASTHDELPSIALLVKSTKLALDWLHENYWQIQLGHVDDIKSQLPNLLLRYKDLRKVDIKNYRGSTFDHLPLSIECQNICSDVISLCPVEYHKELLAMLLTEEGYMIPMAKKKRPSADGKLSELLIALWSPLIMSLQQSNEEFLWDLFQVILTKLYVRSEITHPTSFHLSLVKWAEWVVMELYSENSAESSLVKAFDMILAQPGMLSGYLINLSLFKALRRQYKERVDIALEFSSIYENSKSFVEIDDYDVIMRQVLERCSDFEQVQVGTIATVHTANEGGPWISVNDE